MAIPFVGRAVASLGNLSGIALSVFGKTPQGRLARSVLGVFSSKTGVSGGLKTDDIGQVAVRFRADARSAIRGTQRTTKKLSQLETMALNRTIKRAYSRTVTALSNQYEVKRKDLTRMNGKQGQVQFWPAIQGSYTPNGSFNYAALWVGTNRGVMPRRNAPSHQLKARKPFKAKPGSEPFKSKSTGNWLSPVDKGPPVLMLAYMDPEEVNRIAEGIVRRQMKTFFPGELRRLTKLRL